MVGMGNQDQLRLPLPLAEFSEGLCPMPTNKSPVVDRLTMEFYRMLWDTLGPAFAIVLAGSLGSGVILLWCRRAMLPKTGDLRDLQN